MIDCTQRRTNEFRRASARGRDGPQDPGCDSPCCRAAREHAGARRRADASRAARDQATVFGARRGAGPQGAQPRARPPASRRRTSRAVRGSCEPPAPTHGARRRRHVRRKMRCQSRASAAWLQEDWMPPCALRLLPRRVGRVEQPECRGCAAAPVAALRPVWRGVKGHRARTRPGAARDHAAPWRPRHGAALRLVGERRRLPRRPTRRAVVANRVAVRIAAGERAALGGGGRECEGSRARAERMEREARGRESGAWPGVWRARDVACSLDEYLPRPERAPAARTHTPAETPTRPQATPTAAAAKQIPPRPLCLSRACLSVCPSLSLSLSLSLSSWSRGHSRGSSPVDGHVLARDTQGDPRLLGDGPLDGPLVLVA